MPSRAASVQIRMRSGSVSGSALKRRFSSSRRSVEVAPVKQAMRSSGSRSCNASSSRRSSQRRVSSYSVNRSKASVGPLSVGRHILSNPGGELHEADVGSVRIPTCDLQHLVNQHLIADTGIDCLGRPRLPPCVICASALRLVFRRVLQLDRLEQRSSRLDARQHPQTCCSSLLRCFSNVRANAAIDESSRCCRPDHDQPRACDRGRRQIACPFGDERVVSSQLVGKDKFGRIGRQAVDRPSLRHA